MTVQARIEVRDNRLLNCYEVSVDGVQAGFLGYQPGPQALVMTHTEVDDAFSGQGIGSALVRGALDDVRRRDLHAMPFCPFVLKFIESHREYVDLVPESRRARFGL